MNKEQRKARKVVKARKIRKLYIIERNSQRAFNQMMITRSKNAYRYERYINRLEREKKLEKESVKA